VSRKWVVNASPVILLAKAGAIDLLSQLPQELVVPASVATELSHGPSADPARTWLEGPGRQFVRPDLAVTTEIAAWDLGMGETAVLNWAYQRREFEVIVDDRAARKCGQIFGLKVRGTLGVVLAGKVRGLIPNARPVCETLLQSGLHIHPQFMDAALRLVGE
jgi:predicted nucleic acid-binding protein